MNTLCLLKQKAFCASILLCFLFTFFTTLWADNSVVEVSLPNEIVTKMIQYESFLIDKSAVNQKIFRAFDSTYIQRLKTLCADCLVLDITTPQMEAFCQWARKRLPTKEELNIAGVKDENSFRCAMDKDRLNQAAPSKGIDEVLNPGKSFGQIKGGTCDLVE